MDKIYETIILDFLKYINEQKNSNCINDENIKFFIKDKCVNGINVYLETDKCQEPGCSEIIKNKYKYCSRHQKTNKKIKNLIKEYQIDLENKY